MNYEKCYEYKHIKFKSGILDNIIDAVYVITLKNSYRLKNVYKQINEFKLSKNNYIQINERYKNCKIDLCKQKSAYHLYKNNFNICNHALKNKFNNILILEDDFIFDNQIKNKNIIKDLEYFFNNYEFDIYSLGSPFLFIIPKTLKHFKYLYGGLAHAIIFSKNGMEKLVKEYNRNPCMKNKSNDEHHDILFNYMYNNKYMYYKPLCYQPLENTENQSSWDNKIWLKLNRFFFSIIEIDKKPIIGLKRMFIINYFITILIYLIIFFSIFNLVKMK
tara:strand:- start:999 stop:1823 length:825 start_codon:yes stop_codon:yes gene_type:complete